MDAAEDYCSYSDQEAKDGALISNVTEPLPPRKKGRQGNLEIFSCYVIY